MASIHFFPRQMTCNLRAGNKFYTKSHDSHEISTCHFIIPLSCFMNHTLQFSVLISLFKYRKHNHHHFKSIQKHLKRRIETTSSIYTEIQWTRHGFIERQKGKPTVKNIDSLLWIWREGFYQIFLEKKPCPRMSRVSLNWLEHLKLNRYTDEIVPGI